MTSSITTLLSIFWEGVCLALIPVCNIFSLSLLLSSTLFTLSANPDQHISPSLRTSSSSSSPFPPPLISLCSQSVRLHDCHPAHVCGADEGAVCFQVLSLSSLCVWCMYDDTWTVGCCRLRRHPEQTGTWCSHPKKIAAPVTHCFQHLEQEMHQLVSLMRPGVRYCHLSFRLCRFVVNGAVLSLLRHIKHYQQWLTKQLSILLLRSVFRGKC